MQIGSGIICATYLTHYLWFSWLWHLSERQPAFASQPAQKTACLSWAATSPTPCPIGRPCRARGTQGASDSAAAGYVHVCFRCDGLVTQT